MWRLEYDVLGIDAAQGMAEAAETLFRDTFPAGVQTKLDALMFGVRDCRSTRDVQALAQTIAQMLEDEAQAQEVPKPKRTRWRIAAAKRWAKPLAAGARCCA